jgi:hypothetical protein
LLPPLLRSCPTRPGRHRHPTDEQDEDSGRRDRVLAPARAAVLQELQHTDRGHGTKLLCHRIGIIKEGDAATREAIAKFASLVRLSIEILCTLLRLNCDLATAFEDALVAHDGAEGMEFTADVGETATAECRHAKAWPVG